MSARTYEDALRDTTLRGRHCLGFGNRIFQRREGCVETRKKRICSGKVHFPATLYDPIFNELLYNVDGRLCVETNRGTQSVCSDIS